MDWLKNFNIFIQGVILSTILVGILSFIVFILFIFKVKIKKERLRYIYAFSSGFMIVTAIVGQWVSARSSLNEFWNNENKTHSDGHFEPTNIQIIITMSIILIGLIIGSFIGLGIKKISMKVNNSHPIKTQNHKHSHLLDTVDEKIGEFKKDKNALIYMILTHRLPAGLILGILLVNFNKGSGEFAFAALLGFVLHIIPEIIIIYFAKIENGESRFRSLIFSIITKLLIVPFIFIGILMAHSVDMNSKGTFWIIPLLLTISGVVMIWGAIFELGPLFIHTKEDSNTYKMIFAFIIGLGFSMLIQLIHVH